MKLWKSGMDAAGPDWYFDATLTQPSVMLMDSQELPGYRHYIAVEQRGLITPTRGGHHWYIDSSHFEQFIRNVIEGMAAHNLWNFACILFEENRLQIRRGYGFGDEIHTNTEINLMRSLFENPRLELTDWQISAGGNGYEFNILAEGQSKFDLATYLNAI